MWLKTLAYTEFSNTPEEWCLRDLELGPKTLIVGKNATGKSRTLSVIRALAHSIKGIVKLSEGDYRTTFSADELTKYHYEFRAHNGVIEHEEFIENDVTRLERNADGTGSLDAVEYGHRLKFQVPVDELALVAKRDLIQHPYLEGIHQWGQNLRHYEFGGPMGRGRLAAFIPNGPKVDPSDPDQVVGVFREGERKFGSSYPTRIAAYLNEIGYDVENVSIAELSSTKYQPLIPGLGNPTLSGLAVKERDRNALTMHTDMSQGMFRALAVLVHMGYAEMTHSASCICMDDIGEGLDFDRSSRLIELLMRVAGSNDIQLVLATNDRFVMNSVPLEAWSILRRRGNCCTVLNYVNGRQYFDDFKFTGLNNFDLFRAELAEMH